MYEARLVYLVDKLNIERQVGIHLLNNQTERFHTWIENYQSEVIVRLLSLFLKCIKHNL
jgi:hypothetical protein